MSFSYAYAYVIAAQQLNQRLRRITLQVDEPEVLDVKQAGDSAVGVYFEGPDGEGRNYSVRYADGDRIDIDVVLHARGAGTRWAAAAGRGDRVGLDHARSWYCPEPDTEWQLLVADLCGLPATARIIEQLPGGMPVTAIVEVVDEADLAYWRFDSETWDAKFALVSDEVGAVWERAVADGRSERVADEEYVEALERAGL